jgi:hypothetical protein
MRADEDQVRAPNVDEIDDMFARAVEEDAAERERREGARIARRLAIAFLLIMTTGAVCWVVLPRFGMVLPPAAVLAIFGVMAFASLATLLERRPRTPAPRELDGARPIRCCGPRPVGEMSRDRHDEGPGCRS